MTPRALPTLLAVALLLTPVGAAAMGGGAQGAAPHAPPALAPRPSILIDGNDDLTPENGVRGGSGTAEDPYRISGWLVLQTEPYGIHVRNTTAHVVIEDVVVDGVASAERAFLCRVMDDCPPPELPNSAGIELWGTENVTVQDTRVLLQRGGEGVSASDASRLLIQRVAVDLPLGHDHVDTAYNYGIGLWNVADARVHNVSTAGIQWITVSLRDGRNVTVSGSHLNGEGGISGAAHIVVSGEESADVTIAHNHFEHSGITLQDTIDNVTVVGNRFQESSTAVWVPARPGTQIRGFFFCGNTIQGDRDAWALGIDDTPGALLVGNRVENSRTGLYLSYPGVRVERNVFHNNSGYALRLHQKDIAVHNNSFVGNGHGVFAGGYNDLRYNWWGDPAGPSGHGPGQGDPIEEGQMARGSVSYEPWLTEPPHAGPGAVDCAAELAAFHGRETGAP